MRTALLTFLLLGAGLVFLPDFPSSMRAQEPAEIEAAAADADPAADLAQAKRDLSLTKLRMENLLSEQELTRLQTQIEHTNAVADLKEYNVYVKDAAVAQAALDLLYSKDGLADAEEELRQLSMMYDANDLADATAQIVMDRSNRDIERQRTALGLAEKEHANWIKFGLPREFAEVQNAESLAAAEMNLMFLAQTLAMKELEIEIDDLQQTIKEITAEMQESGD